MVRFMLSIRPGSALDSPLSEWHRDRGPQGWGVFSDRNGTIRTGAPRAGGSAAGTGPAERKRPRPGRAAHRVRPARLPGAALRPEPSRGLAARAGLAGRGTAAGPDPRPGDEFRRPVAGVDAPRLDGAGGGATLASDRAQSQEPRRSARAWCGPG